MPPAGCAARCADPHCGRPIDGAAVACAVCALPHCGTCLAERLVPPGGRARVCRGCAIALARPLRLTGHRAA